MIELNDNQVGVLTKVARGKVKTQATFPSVEADGFHREKIDQHFRDMLALVGAGLMYDVTTMPKFSDIVTRYKEESGRDIRIMQPTPFAYRMFSRNKGDRWIN